MDQQRRSGSGLGKAMGLVGAILGVVALMALGLIASNVEAFKESKWYPTTSETVEPNEQQLVHLRSLHKAMLSQYPAAEIRVNIEGRRNRQGLKQYLELEFIEPGFAINKDDPKLTAREIAVQAATIYPDSEPLDGLIISLVRNSDSFISFSIHDRYWFTMDELNLGNVT